MESLKPQKTLVEQVYERILHAICEGTLPAGSRVTQDELAAQLQVSRQPVMTALGLLLQQGFLVEHGRRGLQVAPVGRAHFDAIYECRSVEGAGRTLDSHIRNLRHRNRGRPLGSGLHPDGASNRVSFCEKPRK